MVASIWDKFDKAIDVEALAKEVAETKENGGSFREVPHNRYEVKVEKLELSLSKAGDPMVKVWFKVLTGEYKGSLIFMNQVVNQPFQIHIVNELLRSMDSGIEIEFKSYRQYAQLLLDVHEAIYGKLEYVLDYGEGKKGFSTYEILEVFEVA